MKKKILAMLESRQQSLLDTAKEAKRDLTNEEKAEFDGLQRQIDEIKNLKEDSKRQAEPAQDLGARAIEDERARVMEITSLCREFNVEADAYIKDGATVDAVRTAILNDMMKRNHPAPSGNGVAEVTKAEEDKFRAAATDALMLRSGLAVENEAEGARELRGLSIRDLAIECASREGKDTRSLIRMDGGDLYNEMSRGFYNPTAAFPAILDGTIKKSIVHMYNKVPTTFQEFTTVGSLKDFKETQDHEYVIGGFGDFVKVPENGELKADRPSTKLLPNRKLDTYGKSFSMTRQAFINDDIGFLTEMPGLYATSAKKTIDKAVYKILVENGKIFDGVALFHANHKNLLSTGSKPTQSAIQSMILQMQKQTDQFGDPIYMTPATIVVPVGYEFDLAVILKSAQVVGSDHNDINPLYNYPLKIVQSPVINAMAGSNAAPWFMIADPMSAKGIQVDYLNGQQTPSVRRMEQAGTLGFTWDIWLDWGIAVRDFRGLYKNPGEVIA